jgi:hypothetical protein
MSTVEQRRQALEELRGADRILGGVLGTLQYVLRQQRRDVIGMEGADGLWGEATQGDVDSAIGQLAEAQYGFRRAVGLLGGDAGDWVELERWGYAELVVDGIFEALLLLRANRNIAAAEQVHTQIRSLFAAVRASDPSLQDVMPLADWEDEGVAGEVQSMWAFNKPAVFGIALFVLIQVAIALFVLM